MTIRAQGRSRQWMACTAAALGLLSPWGTSVTTQAQRGQKPVVLHDVHPGRGRNYATVQDMWNGAALLIEGTIVAETPADEDEGRTVITVYDVAVTEIFKRNGDQQLPTTVRVRQVGGRRETDTRLDVYRDRNFPPFEIGQHCVLFLAPAQPGQYWTLARREGVFFVSNNNLQTPSHNEAAQVLARGTIGELRETLRQLARRLP